MTAHASRHPNISRNRLTQSQKAGGFTMQRDINWRPSAMASKEPTPQVQRQFVEGRQAVTKRSIAQFRITSRQSELRQSLERFTSFRQPPVFIQWAALDLKHIFR